MAHTYRINAFSRTMLGLLLLLGVNGLGANSAKDDGNRWFDTREQAGLPTFDGSLDSLPQPGKPPASKGKVRE